MGKQRFDVTQAIQNMDGSDAMTVTRTDVRCETCSQFILETTPFTLREAFRQCLTSESIAPNGQPVRAPGPIRYQRVRLALRIDDARDTIRLSDKQIEELGELASKFLSPVAQYRVWNILGIEEEDEEDEEDEKNEEDKE